MTETADERAARANRIFAKCRERGRASLADVATLSEDVGAIAAELGVANGRAETAEAKVARLTADRDHTVIREVAARFEIRQLRARLDGLGAIADEFHAAELQNAQAVAAWSVADRRGTDACIAAGKQLNVAQSRLCAAQDAWADAVAEFRSDGAANANATPAPDQPEATAEGRNTERNNT